MKNWKTTLAGCFAAGLNVLANGTDWKHLLASAAIAVIGYLAKDAGADPSSVDKAEKIAEQVVVKAASK